MVETVENQSLTRPSAVIFSLSEVSASFMSTTSITYTLKEPYELSRNSSALPSSIYSDTTLRGENISLSFRTSQSPALLLYISSFYREYLALLVNQHGEDDKTDSSPLPSSPLLSSPAKLIVMHSLRFKENTGHGYY